MEPSLWVRTWEDSFQGVLVEMVEDLLYLRDLQNQNPPSCVSEVQAALLTS